MEDIHNLLILMVVVWVFGKLFRFFSLPVIFGELLGGILVGPAVMGLVEPNETITLLAELGIFFLMLHAGLETNPGTLISASKKSILIALTGASLPFILGFIFCLYLNFPIPEASFIAISISASAIAISVRMLKDFKLENTKVGNIILGGCILSDILVMIGFSVILDIIQTGQISFTMLSLLLVKIAVFFIGVIFIGQKLEPYFNRFFQNKGFTLTLIIALGLGLLAEYIGLHIIIGAFLAGLFIREEVIEPKIYRKIEDRIYGFSYSFLGPVFFTSLAFHLSFEGIVKYPWFTLILFIVAYAGKYLGSVYAAIKQNLPMGQSAIIGIAMNARGEINLIIISIGLNQGIISQDIFSILIFLVFSATLLSIILLKPLKKRYC